MNASPVEKTPKEPDTPNRQFPVRRALRWGEHCLAALVLLVFVVVLTPVGSWLYGNFDCQNPLRPAKYIICLGGDGQRVLEAARLLRDGYGEKLIVSNHGPAAGKMRDLAVDWGAPADRIIVDDRSPKTRCHPYTACRAGDIDPANDVCIVVTSYHHMKRSRACFKKAGYRHLIMREPRWERDARNVDRMGFVGRVKVLPNLLYEGAAWVEYWIRGVI